VDDGPFQELDLVISSAGSSGCKHQAAKGQGKEEFEQEYASLVYNSR
jgi:hypothetical protein